jgi:lysophospholipase L1-like esterase
VACEDATAQSHVKLSAAETCLEINREISLGVLLSRTKARLNATGSLKIVAVGSSSTSGLWVLNPAATFPEIMRQELRLLRPKVQIEIVNSGRIGDTISGAINRFERDVLRYDPDLVVWQLGTNDVAWGGNAHGLKDLVIAGVRILKASRADVILMDLQYTPMVRASSGHLLMQSIIAEAARVERVGLFSRFELMRRTIEAGLPPDALVSWDGLHNSLAGYECVGRALARAVSAALR